MVQILRATTPAERRRALAVGHAAREDGTLLEPYQALRLRLPRRHEGTWWLLTDEGIDVCSLMCYPLRFQVGGDVLAGHGLGAVVTLPHARRRGHARRLCEHAIAEAEAGGASIGLLFSAIPPAYYERLGYQAAPAWNPVARDLPALAAGGPQADLWPIDPRHDVPTLVDLYRRAHPGLHMARDDAGWEDALRRNPLDTFYVLGEPARGYVRVLADEPEQLFVVELMVPDAERLPVLRRLAALGLGTQRTYLEGWFEPPADGAGYFEDAGRATTLPMLRGAVDVQGARFWGSDYF